MGNVQNCDSYINIPSSQTYRSHIKCLAKSYELLKSSLNKTQLNRIFPKTSSSAYVPRVLWKNCNENRGKKNVAAFVLKRVIDVMVA
jgi:hypothetical protein